MKEAGLLSGLRRYRNMFGEPGKGIHSHRVAGLAAVDLGMTIVAGGFISRYYNVNFLYVTAGLIGLGVFVHFMFGVETALNGMLKRTVSNNRTE